MRVTARFLASSRGPANTSWFSGTVRSVHHDGRADIDYDDGDAEDLVSPRYIRVFKQQVAPEKLAALIADVDDAADADAAAAGDSLRLPRASRQAAHDEMRGPERRGLRVVLHGCTRPSRRARRLQVVCRIEFPLLPVRDGLRL